NPDSCSRRHAPTTAARTTPPSMRRATRRTRAGRRRGQSASQDGLAAGTAQALDTRAAFGFVVVGQFLAGLDVPGRSDPDGVTGNLGVAVRLAAADDEPRDVAADRCVAHGLPVQDDAPAAAFLQVLLLAAVAFLPRDLLSGVVDDARVLGDRFECIDTPA